MKISKAVIFTAGICLSGLGLLMIVIYFGGV